MVDSHTAYAIVIMALGILIGIIGILNMMGNLSSIHWYHRQRITEETMPQRKICSLATKYI